MKSLGVVRATLLVDRDKAMKNIESMSRKLKGTSTLFRPHFKTHQSAEIGEWFRASGTAAITVSSVDMARYFADHGWSDITVAFPVNPLEVDAIDLLAGAVTLHLVVDSHAPLSSMEDALHHKVSVWIKIDTGNHRVGLWWEDTDRIVSLAGAIRRSSVMDFSGLLVHSGHSYRAGSIEEIEEIHRQTLSRLVEVKEMLLRCGFSCCRISTGDTPCCSVVESFEGIDEIRPGNFVFYDLMQSRLGVCGEDQIAVAVACPVVSKNERRKQVVMYGGAAHLSNQSIPDSVCGRIYGYAAAGKGDSWIGAIHSAPVVSLSQEHGTVRLSGELFEEIAVGDILAILPVHSCLTCDLFGEYRTLEGDIIFRRRSNDVV
jgi:D-serine deaminase-like pyridoxal phosphate-dependent protein